jgi:N-methylhydantoinase B
VNARSPAAVNQRMVTCHSLVDLVMGALADAIPDRVVADSAGCQYNYVATYTPERDRWDSFGEVTPGGIGANATLDGMDVMACHVTNCAMPTIEATEAEAPVLYLRREFRANSAGAGYRRGGSGQVQVYKLLAPESEFHRTSQKARIRPRGFAGGHEGASGCWIINEGRQDERVCEHTIGDIERLSQGDTVSFYTTAGGGYGDPRTRERERVAADLRDGFITADHAFAVYGFEAGDVRQPLPCAVSSILRK